MDFELRLFAQSNDLFMLGISKLYFRSLSTVAVDRETDSVKERKFAVYSSVSQLQLHRESRALGEKLAKSENFGSIVLQIIYVSAEKLFVLK